MEREKSHMRTMAATRSPSSFIRKGVGMGYSKYRESVRELCNEMIAMIIAAFEQRQERYSCLSSARSARSAVPDPSPAFGDGDA